MKLTCPCEGSPFVDWWWNPRNNKTMTFIRCESCDTIGKDFETEEEAIKDWLADDSLQS